MFHNLEIVTRVKKKMSYILINPNESQNIRVQFEIKKLEYCKISRICRYMFAALQTKQIKIPTLTRNFSKLWNNKLR